MSPAVASHLASAVFLIAVVCRGLYRSYCDLTPSQGARARQASRSRLVPVFGALAALSLAVATKSAVDYASLSYRVWADERFESPSRCFESDGRFPYLSGVNVARWLNDTPIYRDAREIVAEKARRLFWGQQIDLGMIVWSLLLSIEGRRRRIPYTWAYYCLAQLVSLSFAQNLFYVAMLLAPTPLPPASRPWVLDRVFPPKPNNWFPHPVVTTSVLYLGRAMMALLPVMAGSTATSSWPTLVLSATSLVLLAIPTVAPRSWGAVYSSPHGAHDSHVKTFRTFSLATFVMHALSTGYALADNAPDSHHHRHSKRMPMGTAKRSDWERASTAVAKVLGSTADHPVVAAVGRDVLLSALSLGLWAAVRAMDSRQIIKAAWPFAASPSCGARSQSMADDVAGTARSVAATAAGDGKAESPAPAPRGRGRPRKVKWKDQTLEETDGDTAYKPSAGEVSAAVEGDVLPAEEDVDWEAAALAWVMTMVGGLGCGSAGVFGGECISR